jgi:hypothetical protein
MSIPVPAAFAAGQDGGNLVDESFFALVCDESRLAIPQALLEAVRHHKARRSEHMRSAQLHNCGGNHLRLSGQLIVR